MSDDKKHDDSKPNDFKAHPGQPVGKPGSDPTNHAKNDQATTQGHTGEDTKDKAMPDRTQPNHSGEQSSNK